MVGVCNTCTNRNLDLQLTTLATRQTDHCIPGCDMIELLLSFLADLPGTCKWTAKGISKTVSPCVQRHTAALQIIKICTTHIAIELQILSGAPRAREIVEVGIETIQFPCRDCTSSLRRGLMVP